MELKRLVFFVLPAITQLALTQEHRQTMFVHKYSDVYKNEQAWDVIAPGEYGKGAMEDVSRLYYSNPDNFREVVDFLEDIAPDVIAAAVGVLAGVYATSLPGSVGAAVAVTSLAKATTSKILNTESTVGLKQHILRVKDEETANIIIINNDNTITFHSTSGDSETVYDWEPVKKKKASKLP
ncbi:hypothetical protein PT974_07585 [Cladobotryum mycophilum]|uniref:Up-regulated in Daf-2 domain-containing protein n=1 Tax=Cladobotryum mycophilum TaxID=491253 RepID=A0ABR0SR00_9HYPO